MKEARNIVILVLVVLFIFVGVGVAISRLNKKTPTEDGKKQAGFIQQIFGGFAAPDNIASARVTPTPTATPTPAVTVVTTTTTSDEPAFTFSATATPGTRRVSTAPAAPSQTKGGVPAKSIPSTGANPAVVLVALLGLTSGLYLSRKA